MEKENSIISWPQDQASVQSIYRELINSWNEMNNEAYADLFAEAGSIVGFDGSQANGRHEIRKHLSSIFADHKPARFVTITREIRWLSDDVALLRASAGMVPRGKNEINPQTNAIQSMLVVKAKDKLEIVLFQNTPAAFHGRRELSEQLTAELQKQFIATKQSQGM